MPYLFATDAVSELLRQKPAASYVRWVAGIHREEQFISAVTAAELYKGACKSTSRDLHLSNIEDRVLPSVTILPFDVATAKVFGQLGALLEGSGKRLDDADLMIAATAIYHDIELVTGNIRHFQRVPELRINRILADTR